jgi:uncharacterized protein
MHVDPYIVLGSAVVGLLVGLTGAGGGALMTPMLILLFGVQPSAAISSDLVAAVLMRPVGAAVHLRKGTVNLRLVGWMVLGSVPAAFAGAYLLHVLGGPAQQSHVEIALGAALLAGAAAMVLRYVLDRRAGNERRAAVPLTLAAALGALAFGHVEFAVTTSIVIGSVPAVLLGSLLSAWAPDRYIRPVITFVIFASGLKYIGVGTTTLGWILVGMLAAAGVWLAATRPWRAAEQPAVPDEPDAAPQEQSLAGPAGQGPGG